jgi:UDP-N-acetylmuramate dehydrogenase
VTGVHLHLERGAWPDSRRELRAILQSRRGKFPRKLPNCGSVFKNDPAVFAASGPPGFLLEQCGLKGRRQGDAEISRQHANFIVNIGQASARDILTLVRDMRDAVEETFGHRLATEVRYLDPAGAIRPVSDQLGLGNIRT